MPREWVNTGDVRIGRLRPPAQDGELGRSIPVPAPAPLDLEFKQPRAAAVVKLGSRRRSDFSQLFVRLGPVVHLTRGVRGQLVASNVEPEGCAVCVLRVSPDGRASISRGALHWLGASEDSWLSLSETDSESKMVLEVVV